MLHLSTKSHISVGIAEVLNYRIVFVFIFHSYVVLLESEFPYWLDGHEILFFCFRWICEQRCFFGV